MTRRSPPALKRMLQASEGRPREEAWAAFVEEYSRLILQVAHSFVGSHDAVMDRYAYALEGLRRDDLRRLADLVSADVDPQLLPASGTGPEEAAIALDAQDTPGVRGPLMRSQACRT